MNIIIFYNVINYVKRFEKKDYFLYLKNFVKVMCFRNLIDFFVFKYGCF